MGKGRIIFSALLVLVLAAMSSPAAENDVNDNMNADNVSPVNDSTASPTTVNLERPAGSVANLQYIWSMTGIERDPIIIVINQSNKDLTGAAKYEGSDSAPWNAVVIGSVSGDKVDLVMTSTKGTEMVSTKMSGTFSADTIAGKFIQTDMGGKMKKSGDFSAVWINPDISAYTPANITEASTKPTEISRASSPVSEVTSQSTNAAATGSTMLGSGPSDERTQVQIGGKTQYVDVRKYGRKYQEQYEMGGDLNFIPPGMGGSSL